MSLSQTSDKPVLRLLDIDISEIKNYPSALQDMMFHRRFEGMIVRNVLPKDITEQVSSSLEQGGGDMNYTYIDTSYMKDFLTYKPPFLFGMPIVNVYVQSDLKDYFTYADAFRRACSALFQGKLNFEERVESIFRNLSDGLPVQIPTGPEGQTYSSATIRVLPEGHEIDVHVGNEFMLLPGAEPLKNLIDFTDQLSYFIPLTVPEGGGELVIYSLEWDAEARSKDTPKVHHSIDHLLNQDDSKVFAPDPGDMLLFDGGRYYHRVTKVLGHCPRRTIGGFLGFSLKHDAVYYWS